MECWDGSVGCSAEDCCGPGATTWVAEGGTGIAGGVISDGDIYINEVPIIFDEGMAMIHFFDMDGSLTGAINSVTGMTGVVASLDEIGGLMLYAADGRDIKVSLTAAGSIAVGSFAGTWTATAENGDTYLDTCGVCVGGATGKEPCEPEPEPEVCCKYPNGGIGWDPAGFCEAGLGIALEESGCDIVCCWSEDGEAWPGINRYDCDQEGGESTPMELGCGP